MKRHRNHVKSRRGGLPRRPRVGEAPALRRCGKAAALCAAVAGVFVVLTFLPSGPAWGQERPALSLVEARGFSAGSISATGRVWPLVSARIGARVSGHIAGFGKDAAGQMLDAGMTVKAGDALFSLDETTFRNALGVSEAALKSAQANLANLTAKTRPERLEQLRQALAELDARLADRQREEERFQRLVEQEKTLPGRRLEEVQTEVAVLKTLRLAAQARLQEAENGPTRTEIAVAEAAVASAQASLKIAQDDLRDAVVRAPFDGLITRRFKSPGDYVTGAPHTEVLELVSLDRLEVELRLPEAYFGVVQAGKTPVTVRSGLLKAQLRLSVGRVVPMIEPASGTFSVRLTIPPDKREGVVAGMFVTADVEVGANGAGVVVPLRAIVQADGRAVVYVARDGKMVRRAVEVGDKLTESAVVKSGLEAGEKVLVGPADQLRDGAPLPEQLLKNQHGE